MKINIVVFIILLSASFIQSQTIEKSIPFDGKFLITLDGGITYTESDFQESLTDYIIRGNFEYLLSLDDNLFVGFRGFAAAGSLKGGGTATHNLKRADNFRTRITMLGAGATLNYNLDNYVIPFISVGGTYLNFEPTLKDENGEVFVPSHRYTPHNFTAYGEAGIRFRVYDNFLVSLSGGGHYFPDDNLDNVPNTISNGTAKDLFFTGTFGISLLIGGKADDDGDGILNKHDICPNTPVGILVDEYGCPLDTDKDGIPDYVDECPDSKPGIPVNDNGCMADGDGDGIPDNLDKCPYTPAGVEVDLSGCPLDSDKDGVPDYLDECPDTPSSELVNEFGCVIYLPDFETYPKSRMVIPVDQIITVGKNINVLAKSELAHIARYIGSSTHSHWAVVGHSDNKGDYMENRFLSLEWAKNVRSEIIDQGVDSTRISFTGFGPEFPIADNRTEDGRSQNRRIEIYPVEKIGQDAPKEKPKEIQKKPEPVPIKYGMVLPYNSIDEKSVTDKIFTDGRFFCVQHELLPNKVKADESAEQLRFGGFNSFVEEVSLTNTKGYFYNVRVGYFNSLTEAREAARLLSGN